MNACSQVILKKSHSLLMRGAACTISLLLVLLTSQSMAATTVPLDTAPNRQGDLPALQRGAQIFINNCMGCHSIASIRYSRLMDLGLTEAQIKENFIFTGGKIGDQMKTAMPKADAKSWFGVAPPDLSLTAKARSSGAGTGSDWMYSYLRAFYRDDNRPTGWNNLVFPNVAMPHVLYQQQGELQLKTEDGHAKLTPVSSGQMDSAQYDVMTGDLVGFLTWVSDPDKQKRERIGFFVLLALFIMIILTWRLNRAYWRDVK